ncbi:hypothetical protein KXQ82_18360 [Mucilaginibacter sp. HMF5004]|uniref:hypothetical protein n=1 Tax=Mucilaginibacter rivuli TaxID=2857527 RepID=UPI001C601B11|nr:hypothetical protein [Mucilaginibacter rivuli]MBW4891694.1 hypothetical protein [Mucilaginibacter rivuli]
MELFSAEQKVILLGDFEFICYTLNNGDKVFSHTRLLNIIMADYSNQNLHKHLSALVPYLPFLFIQRKIRLSIVFMKDGQRIRAISYADFITICKAFVKADEAGLLDSKFFLAAILSRRFLHYDTEQQLSKTNITT